MVKPAIHSREEERLLALDSYSILDTLPEADYDNITEIAAQICGTPISLVSLIDLKRQWFKSHHGLDVTETPREYAFCAHALNYSDTIFEIPDARNDIRFSDNPLVTNDPHVIFYAGVPLLTDDGLPLGTLCVIDNKPSKLTNAQKKALRALAAQVMNLLSLRKNKQSLEASLSMLEEKNRTLERFAYIAAHDLKSPLNSMISIVGLFEDSYASVLDEEGMKWLNHLSQSAGKLKGLIDGLLDYSRCEMVQKEIKTILFVKNIVAGVAGLFASEKNIAIELDTELTIVKINSTAIDQILINLISNAVKYCDKPEVKIVIKVTQSQTHYIFAVADNGPGIAKAGREKIFDLFEVGTKADKYGKSGNGIGLASVKRMVERLGGTIDVESEIGMGSIFVFTIEK